MVLARERQNRIYLNDGRGNYTDDTAARLPVDDDNSRAVALGDVDGDGDLDMVVVNIMFSGQQNRLYLNDGDGNFTDATAVRMRADEDSSRSVALGDVDGDGDPDVVFGNHRDDDLLYLNLRRQLVTLSPMNAGNEFRYDAFARYGPPRPWDLALVVVSTGTASVPIPPFGTLGIDLFRAAGFPPFLVIQPDGVNPVSFTVPDNPNLIGLSVYAQALLLPFEGQGHLTNVTADTIR